MRINLIIQLVPVLLAVGILASPYPYDMKKDIGKRDPDNCDEGWVVYSNNCYKFVFHTMLSAKIEWQESRSICQTNGADLVSISDQSEQKFILAEVQKLSSDEYFWLGYNDRKQEGSFVWSDGLQSLFTNWFNITQNSLNKNCVVMYAGTGQWVNYYCSDPFDYICKKAKETPPTTAPPTTAPPTTAPPTTAPPTTAPSSPGSKLVGIQLICSSNNMQIEIPKSSLPGVLVDDLHLEDQACGAEQNVTHFTLQTAFDECGTKTKETASTLSFTNDVDFLRSAAHHDVITRVDDEFAVVFKCTYSREKKLLSSAMHPQKTKVLSEKHSDGELSFSFKMFPNDIFDTPYTDFPVSLKLRQPIYLQVSVKSADESLTILAKDCYATPSKETGSLVYKLIEDGCTIDSTLKDLDAPTNNVQRFSLQMFAFLGNHNNMYFHCDVIACDAKDSGSRCARGCSSSSKRRVRREVAEEKSTELVEGPFILAMPKHLKIN